MDLVGVCVYVCMSGVHACGHLSALEGFALAVVGWTEALVFAFSTILELSFLQFCHI